MKSWAAAVEPDLASGAEKLALIQGGYFALTGVWPLIDMKTFQAVTGPKVDGWLVQTVGALIGVVGGTLISAGLKGRVTPEIRGLAVGSAAALALVDIVFVGRRRIPPVYLLDAAAEAALIAAWAYAEARGSAPLRSVPASLRPPKVD
jgi:hypothetical protein